MIITKLMLLRTTVASFFADRAEREEGASLVEYALLLALVAVVAIGALVLLGHTVNNTLTNVANNINNP